MSTLHSPSFSNHPPPPVPGGGGGFPMVAVAVIGITATALLLVGYYIFVTNCCSRWQLVDPLGRFSIRRIRPNEDPLASYSPSSGQGRGLNELLIRDIPTVQYTKHSREFAKCVVCLSEFQDGEMLRVLPKCSHAFHLDCIDVWLLSNSNCPVCRSVLSGRNRYRPESILAPNSSPQDSDPTAVIRGGGGTGVFTNADSRRFLGRSKVWKSSKPGESCRVSVVGGEGIDVRGGDGGGFRVQPIRRSFSMDSADDRRVYLSVQEIIWQRNNTEERGSSRSMRSMFSFGRGSRNAILPV